MLQGTVSRVCFSPGSPNILISAALDKAIVLTDRRLDAAIASVQCGVPLSALDCKDDGNCITVGTTCAQHLCLRHLCLILLYSQAWPQPCSDRSCNPFEAGSQSLGALQSGLALRSLTWQLLQHVQQRSRTPPLCPPSAIVTCRRHRAAVRPPQAAGAYGQASLLWRGPCQLPTLAAIRGQQACSQAVVHLPHRRHASCSSPCRLSGTPQVPGSRAGEASLLLGANQSFSAELCL